MYNANCLRRQSSHNTDLTCVMVLSNTQSLFWIWASKLLLWRRFDFAFLGQKKKTEMGMVDFSFSSQKVWNLDVSISSRIMRFVFKISLSLLEIGENCRFLDFFGQKFSFSSRTRKQISTFLFSLLETRDVDSIFLFLFSIWLFGISSMPVRHLIISPHYYDQMSPKTKNKKNMFSLHFRLF